jgi:hypothetical protein
MLWASEKVVASSCASFLFLQQILLANNASKSVYYHCALGIHANILRASIFAGHIEGEAFDRDLQEQRKQERVARREAESRRREEVCLHLCVCFRLIYGSICKA